MDEKVKFERTLGPKGQTLGVNIPQELQKYLELEEGSQIIMTGEKGKHGKFIALFKEEKKEE